MNIILSRLQTHPRRLILVLLVGLSLRVAFISLHQRPLISDEKEYDQLALNLSSKASYELNGSINAYRPVGYPAFVSLVYLTVGHHTLLVKLIQALVDIGTAFLIYLLLAAYPERIRILGAALWAFYVPAILYANFLMSESVYAFLLTLSALVLVRAPGDGVRSAILLGILFGMQILIKPGAYIFLFVLPLVFIKLRWSSRRVYILAAAIAFTLAPWLLRNYVAFGHLSLTSNGGINLLIGNNPNSTGAYGINFDSGVLHNSEDEFDADQRAYRSAIEYITSNPGTFFVNAARKIGRLFESEGGLLVWTFHDNPEDTQTRYATKYSSIPILLIAVVNLPYAMILLTSIFGFLSCQRVKTWWAALILFGGWIVLHAVFFGGGRFHFPVMPLITLFASLFIGDASASLRTLSKPNIVLGSLLSVLLVALWIYEGFSIYDI